MKLSAYLALPGKTATKLAEDCEVSVSTITRAASGDLQPTMDLMAKIHRFTKKKVSPNDFLPEEQPASTLFEYKDRYPDAPGFKEGDTSKKAAESIDPSHLRRLVIKRLEKGPATADETASYYQASVLSFSPRFSELKEMGKIVDSGERRPNKSGRKAKVWKLV